MSALILIFIVSVVFYVIHFYWKIRKYPPGPTPIPIFGNMFQMPVDNIHGWLEELSETYGSCYTIWTPIPCVVLTEYSDIKDVFVTQGDKFAHRANLPPESLLQPHENTGILGSSGPNWNLQRRTALKILRDFGMGKNLMEERVVKSIEEMMIQIENIADKKNADLFWPIQLCVGNVINETLFGYHYKYDDCEKFKNFVQILDNHFRILIGKCTMLISAFVWLRHLPFIGEHGYYRIKRNISTYQTFIEEEVEAQVKLYNKDAEPDNFVHAYLQLMDQTRHPGLDKKNLCASVLDFWLAGMETTANSLRWHIAYMMKYPEVQEKVRKEILENVGVSRLPSMADKSKLPYTQAVIHEVQRCSNMLPLQGTHMNIEEAVVQGWKVPPGTNILAQQWTVMRKDDVFADPLKFNPDRYLLPDGKTFNKAVLEKTIPFSIGKRNCVGEGLARMELFLIFSALIQKYEFVPTTSVDLSPKIGTFLTVKPYTCHLKPVY